MEGFAYLCGMKAVKSIIVVSALLVGSLTALHAQDYVINGVSLPVTVYDGDTIPVVNLRDVYIFDSSRFKNKRKEKEYWRKVRDVQKTLPLAREIRGIIIETYEYLLTLPDDKARTQHMKRVEKELMETYTPRMKQLTLRQGKLLIRLVDRECNQTGYDLITVFRGKFRATFYQAFAALFGASLKNTYDPEGEDADTEEIIYMIENGWI